MTPEARVIEALFSVVNKRQETVPFKLNEAQLAVDAALSNRILIPKARQRGISTYFLARNAVKCLGVENTRAVVISHDTESTERMFSRVKFFLDTIKGPQAVIKNNNKNELTFPKTKSVYWIGTAGSRKFGRGDTITDLHCSEVAYWPDAKTLMAGLLQAVPKSGTISVESTGNGMGNWYHSSCIRAAKGVSSFNLCFLPWWQEPEYRLSLTPEVAAALMDNLREDIGEPDLVRAYGLVAEQLAWRRMVLEDEMEGDLRIWNQEYPSCLADCFQIAGGGLFTNVRYVETPEWEKRDQFLHVLKGHPREGGKYALGGDVSGGVGADSSAMEIFDLETGDQVAEWLSNKVDPDVFGGHINLVGRTFNNAYVCVESNNHGILTTATLRNLEYPSDRLYRTPRSTSKHSPKDAVKRVVDIGQRTTSTSKPFIIGELRRKLRSEWTVHSPVLRAELSSFIEHPNGDLGAAEGCFDDTVIAAAQAAFIETKAILAMDDSKPVSQPMRPEDDPFLFDNIIKELEERGHTLPFPINQIDPFL